MQIAVMEDKWGNMEAGRADGHVNGKNDLTGSNGVSLQYMARMTQYYTEGNQVRVLSQPHSLVVIWSQGYICKADLTCLVKNSLCDASGILQN